MQKLFSSTTECSVIKRSRNDPLPKSRSRSVLRRSTWSPSLGGTGLHPAGKGKVISNLQFEIEIKCTIRLKSRQFHIVQFKALIIGNDYVIFYFRLSDNHAVKRVLMMEWQILQYFVMTKPSV